MDLPSSATALAMHRACTAYLERLESGGCAGDVALDRTWDAYVCALAQSGVHCYDPRDRLFESKLRAIMERTDNA